MNITGSYRGPNRVHNTIYLLPIVLKEDPVPPEVLKPLIQFASIFFGMTVKLLKKSNFLGKVTDVWLALTAIHYSNILIVMNVHFHMFLLCDVCCLEYHMIEKILFEIKNKELNLIVTESNSSSNNNTHWISFCSVYT